MISPSLICLSSRDPLLTSFELYYELKRLEHMETEFRADYHVSSSAISSSAVLKRLICKLRRPIFS